MSDGSLLHCDCAAMAVESVVVSCVLQEFSFSGHWCPSPKSLRYSQGRRISRGFEQELTQCRFAAPEMERRDLRSPCYLVGTPNHPGLCLQIISAAVGAARVLLVPPGVRHGMSSGRLSLAIPAG